MSYAIAWADDAFAAAQTYMTDDPDGLARVFDAVDRLTDNPRSAGAFAWGMDRFRIRIGRYRVLYEVSDQTVTIEVVHLGRTR